jgi:multiple sugar transport system ATP-binding protein
MRTEIKKLHQRLGSTIVYVTHDQIEAMTMATRIAGLKEIMTRLPASSTVRSGEARTFDVDLSKVILFDAESGVALKHHND